MSTQAALVFLRTVRQRPDLQAGLAALGPAITSERLLELATELGSPCSAEELQAAFRLDWAMRWLHHHRDEHGPHLSEGRGTLLRGP